MDVIASINDYLDENFPEIYHESTVRGNVFIYEDDPNLVASNKLHKIIRHELGKFNHLIDYKALSTKTQEALEEFKQHKLEHREIVEGLKELYEVHKGEGAAKLGRRGDGGCPLKYRENHFSDLEELIGAVRQLPLTKEKRKKFLKLVLDVELFDWDFEAFYHGFKQQMDKEEIIPLKSGQEVKNIGMPAKKSSALRYLFSLAEASKTILDTVQIPEHFSESLNDDFHFQSRHIFKDLSTFLLENEEFQIPEFKNIFSKAAYKAQKDLIKAYGDFPTLLHYLSSNDKEAYALRENLFIRTEEDFNAARDAIRLGLKRKVDQSSIDVTACPHNSGSNKLPKEITAAASCPYLKAGVLKAKS